MNPLNYITPEFSNNQIFDMNGMNNFEFSNGKNFGDNALNNNPESQASLGFFNDDDFSSTPFFQHNLVGSPVLMAMGMGLGLGLGAGMGMGLQRFNDGGGGIMANNDFNLFQLDDKETQSFPQSFPQSLSRSTSINLDLEPFPVALRRESSWINPNPLHLPLPLPSPNPNPKVSNVSNSSNLSNKIFESSKNVDEPSASLSFPQRAKTEKFANQTELSVLPPQAPLALAPQPSTLSNDSSSLGAENDVCWNKKKYMKKKKKYEDDSDYEEEEEEEIIHSSQNDQLNHHHHSHSHVNESASNDKIVKKINLKQSNRAGRKPPVAVSSNAPSANQLFSSNQNNMDLDLSIYHNPFSRSNVHETSQENELLKNGYQLVHQSKIQLASASRGHRKFVNFLISLRKIKDHSYSILASLKGQVSSVQTMSNHPIVSNTFKSSIATVISSHNLVDSLPAVIIEFETGKTRKDGGHICIAKNQDKNQPSSNDYSDGTFILASHKKDNSLVQTNTKIFIHPKFEVFGNMFLNHTDAIRPQIINENGITLHIQNTNGSSNSNNNSNNNNNSKSSNSNDADFKVNDKKRSLSSSSLNNKESSNEENYHRPDIKKNKSNSLEKLNNNFSTASNKNNYSSSSSFD